MQVVYVNVMLDDIGPDGLEVDEVISQERLRDTLGDADPFRAAGTGRLRARLHRTEDMVHLRGMASASLVAECSRCLQEVGVPISTPLELTLVPRPSEPAANADGEVADDDVAVLTYEDEQIDLAPIYHDAVLLELPMRALCREDCAGLCSQCGHDRNVGPCDCRPVASGPLRALAQVKLSR